MSNQQGAGIPSSFPEAVESGKHTAEERTLCAWELGAKGLTPRWTFTRMWKRDRQSPRPPGGPERSCLPPPAVHSVSSERAECGGGAYQTDFPGVA